LPTLLQIQGHKYDVYKQDEPAIDAYSHLKRWIEFLETEHYHRKLRDDDLVFPPVYFKTGMVVEGSEKEIAYDTISNLIDEISQASGIADRPGKFSTHCYRRGGAQYRFMLAPMREQWPMYKVRWWGGWAEGEDVSTRRFNQSASVEASFRCFSFATFNHSRLFLLSSATHLCDIFWTNSEHMKRIVATPFVLCSARLGNP
jgi:hypothetical protein